jgi:hypothetical protein
MIKFVLAILSGVAVVTLITPASAQQAQIAIVNTPYAALNLRPCPSIETCPPLVALRNGSHVQVMDWPGHKGWVSVATIVHWQYMTGFMSSDYLIFGPGS